MQTILESCRLLQVTEKICHHKLLDTSFSYRQLPV